MIVADSSALVLLARIGQLETLKALAGRVVVPAAVWEEVVVARADAPGAREVAAQTWIEVCLVDAAVATPLLSVLGRGEAEAIALALREPQATLLLDDGRARKLADRLGLARIGTLGLLAKAKRAGLVSAVKPLVGKLQANGMWIEPRIVAAILKEVGE